MNGAHLDFIIAAYAITALVIVGMVVAILRDQAALKKALAAFPARDRESDTP